MLASFLHEIGLLTQLKHPNIVQFEAACLQLETICYLTEYMPNGSLFTFLRRGPIDVRARPPTPIAIALYRDRCDDTHCRPSLRRRRLYAVWLTVTEPPRYTLTPHAHPFHCSPLTVCSAAPRAAQARAHRRARHAVPALVHTATHPPRCAPTTAHLTNYAYLLGPADLKSHNLLVDNEFQLKVCDFGISKILEHDETTNTKLGTLSWMAPEALLDSKYTKESDVYSYGMVLWEIVSGQQPFQELQAPIKIMGRIIEGDRPAMPPHTDPGYAAIVRRCWDWQPHARPSFDFVVRELEKLPGALVKP